MMMRFTERIISVLLVLFLLVYVSYQAFRYYRKPVAVETVYEYNVSRSVDTTGIAIRTEMVINDLASGVENYLYDDGARVTVGDTVAEFYKSSAGDKNLRRVRELEQEIQQLRIDGDPTTSNFGNTEAYNREIKEQLGRLSAMASTGEYLEIDNMRRALTSLLNKKQIATGKAMDFSHRIEKLETELESLAKFQSGEAVTVISAPATGYFSKEVDGYEGRVSAKDIASYTREDYLKLLNAKAPEAPKGLVGRLVLSPNWYFVCTVPKDDIDGVKAGQAVQLQFEQITNPVVALVSQVLEEKDDDTAVLLLQSSQISDDLINLRVSDVVIQFKQYTGLRINTADLRFRTNKDGVTERGVYILRSNTAYFRLVDPVYEEPSFLLSRTYYSSEDYLEPQRSGREPDGESIPDAPVVVAPEPESGDAPDETEEDQEELEDGYKRYVILFDQVITKGNDVYHGKSVQ